MTGFSTITGGISPERVRVGVLLDGWIQESWVLMSLRDLLDSPYAEIAYVRIRKKCRQEREDERLQKNFWYRLYSWLDNRKEISLPDPLEPMNVKTVLDEWGGPVEEAAEGESPREQVDLLLLLGGANALEEDPGSARLGLCTFRFGSADEPPGPPGFWPVLMNRPTSTVDLVLIRRGKENRRLLRVTCRTDRHSVRANRVHLLWRASNLPSKLVKDLYWNGGEPGPSVVSPSRRLRDPHLDALPILRLLLRWIRSGVTSRLTDERLSLAYRFLRRDEEVPVVPEVSEFEVLDPPRGMSWADPFPVEWKGQRFIFFEELHRNTNRGRISVIELRSNGTVSDPVPVLERPYHLSYPFVLEHEGELFMVPETADLGKIELYRCVDFPDKWELEKVILDGVSGVDPTPVHSGGRWWLFTNLRAPRTGIWDEDLCIFMADDLLGPWIEHPANPVKSDVRGSRPAGGFFRSNGRLIRPAQDCSWRYGYGIRLYAVEELSETAYKERECGTIYPSGVSNFRGVHTLNRAGDVLVIDGYNRRLAW